VLSSAFPEVQVPSCWSLGEQHCPAAADVSGHCLPPGPAAAAGPGALGGLGKPEASAGRADPISLLPTGMVAGKRSHCPWEDAIAFIQCFLWRRLAVSRYP